MRRICMVLGLGALLLGGGAAAFGAVVIDRYAWEFPEAGAPSGAADLIAILQVEAQKILAAGHLAPLYVSYADQYSVGYRVYQEPGRVIATLAWAYPYLAPAQQTAARTYVAGELASAQFAPWASYPLASLAGAPRELHPKTQWWYDNSWFQYRPYVQTIYGLWLYGHRTGDWALIQGYWANIKTLYASASSQGNLYGTMGAHVAMARLAQQFNDPAARITALNNLQTQLNAGLTFATIEGNAIRDPTWSSPYSSLPDMYDSRMDGSTYRGWILLNLAPEIGRYLAEENAALRTAVLARHQSGLDTFPLWWVNKADYFCRSWTGDEGTGLVPDLFGMIAPVERWVVGASAAQLRAEMRSAPTGIGDCYWIEALVQAIEASGGAVTWTDVRAPAATATNTPVVSPTPSSTATPTRTSTPVWSPTPTPTPTPTRTATPLYSPTGTPTSSPTRTVTQTATLTRTTTPMFSPTATPTASLTATTSPTASPSRTATPVLSPTAGSAGGTGSRRLLSPGLADGVNDRLFFGPEVEEAVIVNLRGREVCRVRRPAPLAWDGRDNHGNLCTAGEYIVRLRLTDGSATYQTVVLVR